MAEIVLGLGTSHSSQVSLPPEWWREHAELDRRRTPFEERLAALGTSLAPQLEDDVFAEKYSRCQRAVDELAARYARTNADVVVVIGDDQKELFDATNLPAIAIYCGEEIWDLPPDPTTLAPSHAAARWAVHNDVPEAYPVDRELAMHLIAELTGAGFDIAQAGGQRDGCTVGHAFTFVRRRIAGALPIRIVPVLLNTYYPPNQPSAERCWHLGESIAAAIRSFPDERRVCVVASGGLSHFVIDEELDRRVVSALQKGTTDTIAGLQRSELQSGSSEILNWVVAGGALQELQMDLLDYVPGYRSLAGTGCGMTFAAWHPAERPDGTSRGDR